MISWLWMQRSFLVAQRLACWRNMLLWVHLVYRGSYLKYKATFLTAAVTVASTLQIIGPAGTSDLTTHLSLVEKKFSLTSNRSLSSCSLMVIDFAALTKSVLAVSTLDRSYPLSYPPLHITLTIAGLPTVIISWTLCNLNRKTDSKFQVLWVHVN